MNLTGKSFLLYDKYSTILTLECLGNIGLADLLMVFVLGFGVGLTLTMLAVNTAVIYYHIAQRPKSDHEVKTDLHPGISSTRPSPMPLRMPHHLESISAQTYHSISRLGSACGKIYPPLTLKHIGALFGPTVKPKGKVSIPQSTSRAATDFHRLVVADARRVDKLD